MIDRGSLGENKRVNWVKINCHFSIFCSRMVRGLKMFMIPEGHAHGMSLWIPHTCVHTHIISLLFSVIIQQVGCSLCWFIPGRLWFPSLDGRFPKLQRPFPTTPGGTYRDPIQLGPVNALQGLSTSPIQATWEILLQTWSRKLLLFSGQRDWTA